MPRCNISGCKEAEDWRGGRLCVGHGLWTAERMRRCLLAIEEAITSESGLDGLKGEALLRELGYWPSKVATPETAG